MLSPNVVGEFILVKEYDIIAFGTGSAMNIVSEVINMNPSVKVAVIENEMVGGICLTRGCIPSKKLLYAAEVMHEIKRAHLFNIHVESVKVDPSTLLQRVREEIRHESLLIGRSLREHPRIDLYKTTGTFVEDYTVDVRGREIRGEKILLCTGSRPYIPSIEGLSEVGCFRFSDAFKYF